MADLNTLIDQCTRRMRAAEMEGFLPTIGEGVRYGERPDARHMPGPRQPRRQEERELSFTNDDPSADMLRGSFNYLYLDWVITVPWNAIP